MTNQENNNQIPKGEGSQSPKSQELDATNQDINDLKKIVIVQNEVISKLENKIEQFNKQNHEYKQEQQNANEFKDIDVDLSNLLKQSIHSKNISSEDNIKMSEQNTKLSKDIQESQINNDSFLKGMQLLVSSLSKQNQKHVDMQPFDDEKGNVFKWLEQFEVQALRLGLTTDETIKECTYLLPKRIRNQVKEESFDTFKQMSAFIRSNNQQDKTLLELEYYGLQKGDKESYVAFNKRLLEVAEQLDLQEGQHLSRFIVALPQGIREDLIDYKYTDASSLAKLIDLRIKRDQNKELNTKYPGQFKDLDKQISNLKQELQSLRNQQSNYRQGNDYRQQRQYNNYDQNRQQRYPQNQNTEYQNQGRNNYQSNNNKRDGSYGRYNGQRENTNYGKNQGQYKSRYQEQQQKKENHLVTQQPILQEAPQKSQASNQQQAALEFMNQKAQLTNQSPVDVENSINKFANINLQLKEKNCNMATYDNDDVDLYNEQIICDHQALQAMRQDIQQIKDKVRLIESPYGSELQVNQETLDLKDNDDETQFVIETLLNNLGIEEVDIQPYVQQFQARRVLYPNESFNQSIYEILNKRKRDSQGSEEDKQQDPKERNHTYNFRSQQKDQDEKISQSEKNQGEKQKEKPIREDQGTSKSQGVPRAPNLDQLRRNFRYKGAPINQRQDFRNIIDNQGSKSKFIIPSNVTCHGLEINWKDIINQIECAIPLSAVMQMQKVKLIDEKGKEQEVNQQHFNYSVGIKGDQLQPLLDHISIKSMKGYHLIIPIQLRGTFMPALIDGGSTISILSHQTCKQLQIDTRILTHQDTFNTMAGPATPVGVIKQLLFTIGGVQCIWDFVVVDIKNKSFEVLLGSDFLRSCHGIPDYGTNSFSFKTSQGNRYMMRGFQLDMILPSNPLNVCNTIESLGDTHYLSREYLKQKEKEIIQEMPRIVFSSKFWEELESLDPTKWQKKFTKQEIARSEENMAILQEDYSHLQSFQDRSDYNVSIHYYQFQTFGVWAMILYHQGLKIQWNGGYLTQLAQSTYQEIKVLILLKAFNKIYQGMFQSYSISADRKVKVLIEDEWMCQALQKCYEQIPQAQQEEFTHQRELALLLRACNYKGTQVMLDVGEVKSLVDLLAEAKVTEMDDQQQALVEQEMMQTASQQQHGENTTNELIEQNQWGLRDQLETLSEESYMEESFEIIQGDVLQKNSKQTKDYSLFIHVESIKKFGAWAMVIYQGGQKIRWYGGYFDVNNDFKNRDTQIKGLIRAFNKIYHEKLILQTMADSNNVVVYSKDLAMSLYLNLVLQDYIINKQDKELEELRSIASLIKLTSVVNVEDIREAKPLTKFLIDAKLSENQTMELKDLETLSGLAELQVVKKPIDVQEQDLISDYTTNDETKTQEQLITPSNQLSQDSYVILVDEPPSNNFLQHPEEFNVTIYTKALQNFAAWGIIIYYKQKKIKWHAQFLPRDPSTTIEDIQNQSLLEAFSYLAGDRINPYPGVRGDEQVRLYTQEGGIEISLYLISGNSVLERQDGYLRQLNSYANYINFKEVISVTDVGEVKNIVELLIEAKVVEQQTQNTNNNDLNQKDNQIDSISFVHSNEQSQQDLMEQEATLIGADNQQIQNRLDDQPIGLHYKEDMKLAQEIDKCQKIQGDQEIEPQLQGLTQNDHDLLTQQINQQQDITRLPITIGVPNSSNWSLRIELKREREQHYQQEQSKGVQPSKEDTYAICLTNYDKIDQSQTIQPQQPRKEDLYKQSADINLQNNNFQNKEILEKYTSDDVLAMEEQEEGLDQDNNPFIEEKELKHGIFKELDKAATELDEAIYVYQALVKKHELINFVNVEVAIETSPCHYFGAWAVVMRRSLPKSLNVRKARYFSTQSYTMGEIQRQIVTTIAMLINQLKEQELIRQQDVICVSLIDQQLLSKFQSYLVNSPQSPWSFVTLYQDHSKFQAQELVRIAIEANEQLFVYLANNGYYPQGSEMNDNETIIGSLQNNSDLDEDNLIISEPLMEESMVIIEHDPCLTNSEIHVEQNNLALHFAIEPYTKTTVWTMVIYIEGRRKYQYGQYLQSNIEGFQNQNYSLVRKAIALQALAHYESVRGTLLPNQNQEQTCICVQDVMLQELFLKAMDETNINNNPTLRQLHSLVRNTNCKRVLLLGDIGEARTLAYMLIDSKIQEIADDMQMQVSREQAQIRQRQQQYLAYQVIGQREQQAQVFREVQRRTQQRLMPTIQENFVETIDLNLLEHSRTQDQQAESLMIESFWPSDLIRDDDGDVLMIDNFNYDNYLDIRCDLELPLKESKDAFLEFTQVEIQQLIDQQQLDSRISFLTQPTINTQTTTQPQRISVDQYSQWNFAMEDEGEEDFIDSQDYVLLFDGSSTKVSNAIAYVLYKGDKKVSQHAQYVNQDLTNNEVEYQALLTALRHLTKKKLQNKKILILGDSQLVVNQVMMKYKIKEERLNHILRQIQEYLKAFPNLTLQHVRREFNQEPNDLAQALTQAKDQELADFFDGLKAQQQTQKIVEQYEERLEEQLHQLYPNLPNGLYDLIIMDPPFRHQKKIKASPKYPTLTDHQLKILPINSMLTMNGVLLLWCSGPFLAKAISMILFWGLKFVNIVLVWRKIDKNGEAYKGLGMVTKHNYEYLLLAIKGDLNTYLKSTENVSQELCTQEVQCQVTCHSQKPHEFYHRIQQIFKVEQMKCLEIFNRGRTQFNQYLDLYGNELKDYFAPKDKNFVDIDEGLSLIKELEMKSNIINNEKGEDALSNERNLLLELQYDKDVNAKLSQLNVGDKLVPKTKEMYEILKNYMDVFCWEYPQELVGTNTIEHKFDLKPGSKPIAKKYYRVTLEKDQYIGEQIEELLKSGMIEPSGSPYAAPVVLREKKDKTLRMCIDFKGLNSQTIADKYPMQRNDECLDLLQGQIFFVTLDLKAGFWQIFIQNEQRHLTAFIVRQGQYQWVRMPFGLINAPATQQRLMDIVLKDILRKGALVYIDDIIVYGRTLDELYRHLKIVLSRLREHNLKLNQKKCHFFIREKVEFLGHIVSEGKIYPQPEKIESILKMGMPQTHKQMKQFLGSVNYIRRFIPNLDVLLKPLSKMTRTTQPFQWDELAKECFQKVKEALAQKPKLCLPDYNKEFIVHTFWNPNTGLYAVLTQMDFKTKIEEPIEYAAKSITESQENYGSNEGQLFCIVWSIQKWEHILHNKHFTLVVEQNAIKWILDNPPSKSKLAKWAIIIQQFDFTVETRANRQNRAMLTKLVQSYDRQQKNLESYMTTEYDPLNNLYCQVCKERDESNPMILCDNCNHGFHLSCIGMTEIPLGYWYCQECLGDIIQNKAVDPTQDLDLIDYLEHGYFDTSLSKSQKEALEIKASNYLYKDNTLYIKVKQPNEETQLKEIPPVGNRLLLIMQLHRNIGHLGQRKTLGVITRWYYWPFIIRDVKRVLKGCLVCQAQKARFYDIPGVFPTKIQQGPFSLISLDCVTGLKETSNGNTAIIVAICAYSKWVEARAIPHPNSSLAAKFFLEDILSRFGAPPTVRTDNGSEFKGEFSRLLEICGIRHIFTTPHYKQANGQVERMNSTIQSSLKKLYQQPGFEQEWDQCLPWTLLGIRATIARGTDYSPYQIVYGRDMIIPGFIIDHHELVEWREPQNEEILQHIMETLQAHETQKKKIEQNLQEMYEEIEKDLLSKRNPTIYDFELGDLVYVQQWRQTKLDLKSIGPYVFLRYNDERKISAMIYNPSSKRELKVSTSNLAPCKIV